LIDLVFFMAPLTDIRLLKLLLFVLAEECTNSEDLLDSDLTRWSSRYCWTCGLSLSGRPSSWHPKKLKFVMQLVLKKSLRLPRVTLVPLMYPDLSFFIVVIIARGILPSSKNDKY
jgi:hypothetical protein